MKRRIRICRACTGGVLSSDERMIRACTGMILSSEERQWEVRETQCESSLVLLRLSLYWLFADFFKVELVRNYLNYAFHGPIDDFDTKTD